MFSDQKKIGRRQGIHALNRMKNLLMFSGCTKLFLLA